MKKYDIILYRGNRIILDDQKWKRNSNETKA